MGMAPRLLGAYRAEGSSGAAFLSCLCNQKISPIHNKPWPAAGAVPHSFIEAAIESRRNLFDHIHSGQEMLCPEPKIVAYVYMSDLRCDFPA